MRLLLQARDVKEHLDQDILDIQDIQDIPRWSWEIL
jgi:hypothetical protein